MSDEMGTTTTLLTEGEPRLAGTEQVLKARLQKFCDEGALQEWKSRPFSRGKHTYATNGHIIGRARRLADVSEIKGSPLTEKLFDKFPGAAYGPLPSYDMPKSSGECPTCDGSGHAHSCPNCDCACSACNGTGEISEVDDVSVSLDGTPVAARYYLLLKALPGIEVGPQKSKKDDPIPFRFDGGEGLLMPLREIRLNHIEAEGRTP